MAAIVVFCGAIWILGRVALASILVRYGLTTVNPDAVDAALSLTPTDAESHQARATLYGNAGLTVLASKELEFAVSLRPRDYDLWLELGIVRDELGNADAALDCFNKAVDLAPYYSKPHWQRGNVLFRMGRYDEAFVDLRSATRSESELLPNFIDLAWQSSRRDARLTEQIVQPQGDNANLACARFFATHGKPNEALAHFKLVHQAPDEVRKEVLQQLVASAAFKQAFELWSIGNQQATGDRSKIAIFDPGFEGALLRDESGFGWRTAPPESTVKLSQDPNEPHSGSRSLRVDFNGNSNAGALLVSQLLLVEPGAHYKLSFAARGQNIITGGPPVLTISEVSGERKLLGRSESLGTGAGGWQNYSVLFSVGPTTEAILINVHREGCSSEPCPIFGSLNLDSFAIERLP